MIFERPAKERLAAGKQRRFQRIACKTRIALAIETKLERLAPVYRGEVTDQAQVDALVVAVTREHDAELLPWLDGPPQTNEAGRSSAFIAGCAASVHDVGRADWRG